MAKLKIVGRQQMVYVSQNVAEKLMRAKEQFESDHMVEVGNEGIMELGQVKQIIPDDPLVIAQGEQAKQKAQERANEEIEWSAYIDKCRAQSIEEKANRMLNSWVKLLWTARHNKPVMQLPKEISDQAMIRLIEYFEKNPTQWHAEQKVYSDLIPFGKVVVMSKVEGVKSFGEMAQGKLI